MTPEERARISRENGAKSKGPVTPEGKAVSSQNARKDTEEERAAKLAHFVPVHPAVLCHEDRRQYDDLIDELIAIYHPSNQLALSIVEDIACDRFQIARLQRNITIHWNLALIKAASKPATQAPELQQMHDEALASAEMLERGGLLSRFNREIARLQQSVARLERRLKFVHENFPDAAPAAKNQTQPEDSAVAENKDVTAETAEKSEENEPVIYVTENVPSVIAAYRREFPGRKIVVLKPDNVAKGIEEEEDLPVAPRKVA